MQKSLKAGAQKSKKNRRSSLSIDKNKIKIMPEEAKIEVKQKTLNTVLGKMERGGGSQNPTLSERLRLGENKGSKII